MTNPRLLKPEELNKAFDGDFGEVQFDHKPTAEDIFLIKLKLVAQAQDIKSVKATVVAIAKYLNKKISKERLAEEIGMNFYELAEALKRSIDEQK